MDQGLARRVKEHARELDFDAVRIASAEPFARENDALLSRIDAGMFEGLSWFTAERAGVSTDPGALVPGARSLVTVAMAYGVGGAWKGGTRGRIARYAWARDYHQVIKTKLHALRDFLLAEAPGGTCAAVVDTGRVVDRAVAARAGLGWYGKNAMILTPGAGSWVLLGELITTAPLAPDPPLRKSCGRCTRCLDACPTGAILAPGVIDSRRCISYLTIEHRGPIPRSLRPLIGQWIFGCDVCQEVCPINDAADGAANPELAAVLDPEPELVPLLAMTRDEFRSRYARTPVGRAGYAGFLRNVCIALGNVGDEAGVPALAGALAHPEPLVRGHAAWALGRLDTIGARGVLSEALQSEADAYVREELTVALEAGAPALA